MFRKYWLKLIACIKKNSESVKTDRFLQSFIVLIVLMACIEGVTLLVQGEVFSDLYRADVPFMWHVIIGGALSCIFCVGLTGRSYWFYPILLQLFLLSHFILCFEGAYLFIRQSPKVVNVQHMDEVISADSSYIALFLILIGLTVMIAYCTSERMFRLSCRMIVGILAIVGILLPDVLNSYRVVKVIVSECGDNSTCGDEGVLSSLSLIESTLAAAAALAMLFISSSIVVPFYARRYFRKNDDLAKESDLSSGNSHNLLNRSDASVSSVSSVASDGSAEEVNAMEGSSSSPYVVAGSRQLMSAAVTGVVAGVCFSIASRLFGRR